MTPFQLSLPFKPTFYAYLACRFFATTSTQIMSVVVGWHVYDIARTPMSLGIVGLVQFLPMASLILPAGDLADRSDRRLIFAASMAAIGVAAASLAGLAFAGNRNLILIYAVLAFFGAGRAFFAPAAQAILPLLVTPNELPKAMAYAASTFQVAVITGPMLGGFAYYLGADAAFSLCGFLAVGAGVMAYFIPIPKPDRARTDVKMLARVGEGVAFIRRTPIVLGAISLDLFAVLLGGAVALMPIFARDILHSGPEGLGLLRAAPAVGAFVVGALLIRKPLDKNSGMVMLSAVAGFGLATLVFGLSRTFWISLAALAVLGACDMVSVYVRSTLVQLATPDEKRGRVSAVNMLFISASNELGEFRAGTMGAWIGVVPSIVVGGLGTLGIVALWTVLFPELTQIGRLSEVRPREPERAPAVEGG